MDLAGFGSFPVFGAKGLDTWTALPLDLDQAQAPVVRRNRAQREAILSQLNRRLQNLDSRNVMKKSKPGELL